jgi:hypothetical protein
MNGHPWPLFDLRLGTPHLELRLPTDDDLLELVRVARSGILQEGRSYFAVPWHELPSPAFERQFLLHWWVSRGSWRPTDWTLGLPSSSMAGQSESRTSAGATSPFVGRW